MGPVWTHYLYVTDPVHSLKMSGSELDHTKDKIKAVEEQQDENLRLNLNWK